MDAGENTPRVVAATVFGETGSACDWAITAPVDGAPAPCASAVRQETRSATTMQRVHRRNVSIAGSI